MPNDKRLKLGLATGLGDGLAGWLGTLASARCGASAKGSSAPGLPLLLVLLALPLQGGCSSGSGSPLDKATAIEREFVIAAATWDLNKDGNVTCDEWKQYVTSLFREADANHDGVLTREEYAALSRSDRLFETVGFDYWDANHDGRISLSEMVDKPNPAFTCSTRTTIACSRLMSACSRAIPPKTLQRTPAVRRRWVAPAAVEPSQPHDRRPLCADRRGGSGSRRTS